MFIGLWLTLHAEEWKVVVSASSFWGFGDSGCQNSPLWPVGEDRFVPIEAKREKRSLVLALQKQAKSSIGEGGD